MAAYCPAPGPDDPLVRSMLTLVDCNVEGLVRSGYGALFQPSSPFAAVLTTLMTLYVAFLGFGLLLGRMQLRVSDLVLSVVKLAVVLALATQWETYQTLVYRFLFDGPAGLANAVLEGGGTGRPIHQGGVFQGLQQSFDQLNAFADAYAKHAPASASPLLGGQASGAMLLTLSAGTLLLSSLGVLLAAKVVLGMLLAVGPVFIALLLFDATRGLFEGWLRASLAFAFAPLAVILLLGVALTMLEPALTQLVELQARGVYPLGPVYSVFILTLVFAGVSAGLLIAGGLIARGFKLPTRRPVVAAAELNATVETPPTPAWLQPRAVRVAAAASALERREAGGRMLAATPVLALTTDRRTSVISSAVERTTSVTPAAAAGGPAGEPRLGQATRRSSGPRVQRTSRRPGR